MEFSKDIGNVLTIKNTCVQLAGKLAMNGISQVYAMVFLVLLKCYTVLEGNTTNHHVLLLKDKFKH